MTESENPVLDWEPYLRELSLALAACREPELMGEFLRSLLTPNELQEVSTRWALVRQIDQGISQRQIAKNLGLSLCKITRGSKQLKMENSPFMAMMDLYKKAVLRGKRSGKDPGDSE